jgi:uncharacterized protein (DUF779 family)
VTLRSIAATESADALLQKLAREHGPLRLQISGSYGVSVICLRADELRLGARDEVVGQLGDTPVTMMINEARYWDGASVVIDVAKGVGVGFSLEGPERVHFTLRKRTDPTLRDWTGQARSPATDS